MKIAGQKIEHAPASELIVFPRGESQIAFRATALLDRKEFEKLCPIPKPPKMRAKGGKMVENPEDPRFTKMISNYNQNFMDYLLIAGLTAPGEKEGDPDLPLEWEKVKIADPSTWNLWDEELMDSGFSDMERKRIYNTIANVNSLTESRLDEARNSFLLQQRAEPEELYSQTDEPNDTQSGELANVSASNLPASPEAGTN